MMDADVKLTPVAKPCGLHREYIKSEIKKILLSKDILVEILVDWYGYPTLIKQNWEEYWAPATRQLSPKGLQILDNFRNVHQQYIISEFSREIAIRYCHYYFCLLEEVINTLKSICDKTVRSILLSKVLGFENFTIRWTDGSNGSACGTSTVRNPCYLLAKIKQPQAYDDPKFLAIITGPSISNTGEAYLFYHYRQYKIDDEFGISLLLYPAVAPAGRANSFALIESFTLGFSNKSDPRSKQRSQVLADLVISPFLSKRYSIDTQEISFVDIGSGSGSLASNIWRQILKTQPCIAQNYKLACFMVGLRVQNPLRHFNKGSLRGTISYLDYFQTDYLQWIQQQKLTQGNYKFDIALICRLLNNLSVFKLGSSNNWQIIQKLGEAELSEADLLSRRFEPSNCLNMSSLSTGSIFLKNSSVLLNDGKSFRHLSLSNYYKGLQSLHYTDMSSHDDMGTIYFPIRQFNPACLRLPDEKSFLEKLCRLARLVVIEDTDLTKNDLIKHLAEHNLENIAASHVNEHNKINLAQIFCLCNSEFENILPGKRIWPDSL